MKPKQIYKSNTEPSKEVLWLKDGLLQEFTSYGWEPLVGGTHHTPETSLPSGNKPIVDVELAGAVLSRVTLNHTEVLRFTNFSDFAAVFVELPEDMLPNYYYECMFDYTELSGPLGTAVMFPRNLNVGDFELEVGNSYHLIIYNNKLYYKSWEL